MTDLILYHADYSTCSQKVRLALAEKGLTYESRPIDFRKEEQVSEAYLKINPNGVVPTLVHGEYVIVDSSCILEYLLHGTQVVMFYLGLALLTQALRSKS